MSEPSIAGTKIGGPNAPKPERKRLDIGQAKRQIVVQVAREFDGSIYSRVIDKADVHPWNGKPNEIVFDRKNRTLDAKVIRRRAEMLAEMLGVPFEEDLKWPCQANKKLACRCPKCIEEGRA